MFKKIKQFTAALMLTFSFSAPVALLVPATVSAQSNVTTSLCEGITAAENSGGVGVNSNACVTDNSGTTRVNSLIKTIINLFSLVVGVISVIMIIVGGLKYITSGGDSSNVTGAKNTIMYALIGLVVVALAQVIVRFVLNKTSGV